VLPCIVRSTLEFVNADAFTLPFKMLPQEDVAGHELGNTDPVDRVSPVLAGILTLRVVSINISKNTKPLSLAWMDAAGH
jgi:hypothetical protein